MQKVKPVITQTKTTADEQYFKIVRKIMDEGEWKDNRTGPRSLSSNIFFFISSWICKLRSFYVV